MSIQREYGRRFVLRRIPRDMEARADRVFMVTQYYAKDGTCYQLQRDVNAPGKIGIFTKIVKMPADSPKVGIEEKISSAEYSQAVAGQNTRIAQKRYCIDKGFYEVVVDEYRDFALIVAGLEILINTNDEEASLLTSMQLPAFLQKERLLEVTHLEQFKNENLAKM